MAIMEDIQSGATASLGLLGGMFAPINPPSFSSESVVPEARRLGTGAVSDVEKAFQEAVNITKPGFKQAGKNITDLLAKAREEIRPMAERKGGFQETLAGILSGDVDITSLPQFQAQQRAIQNVLGFTGQTQSPTGAAFAFQPLISDVFEQIASGAQFEQAQQATGARDLSSLFTTEAQLAGTLPISESERVSSLMTTGAVQRAGMEQELARMLGSLGIQERGLGLQERQLQEQLAQREAEARGDMLSGIFELGSKLFLGG